MRFVLLLIPVLLLSGCGAGGIGAILSHDQYQVQTALNALEEAVNTRNASVLSSSLENPTRVNNLAVTQQGFLSVFLPGVDEVVDFRLTNRKVSAGRQSSTVTADIKAVFSTDDGNKTLTYPAEFTLKRDSGPWKFSVIKFWLPEEWPGFDEGDQSYPDLPTPTNPLPGTDENEVVERFVASLESKNMFEIAPLLLETVVLRDGAKVVFMNYKRFIDLLEKDFRGFTVDEITILGQTVRTPSSTIKDVTADLRVVVNQESFDIRVDFVLENRDGGWFIFALTYKSRIFGLF